LKNIVPLRDGLEEFIAMCKSQVLAVSIPGHPESVNHTYRRGFGGQVYKTSIASAWERMAINEVKRAALRVYGTSKLAILKGAPVRLEIDFCRDTWRKKKKSENHLVVRPDVSNLVKLAEDALFRGLDLDDSAVVILLVKKVEMPGPIKTQMRLQFLPWDNNLKVS
jgi:Holliday junction resolvase RusA-like endonuclease